MLFDIDYGLSGQFILAQIELQDILESSQKAKDTLATIWNFIGESRLLMELLNLGRLLTVVALIFYSYKVYRKVLDDMDYRSIIQSMIPAIILLLMLGNPAQPKTSPVWQTSLQLRNIIYFIDEKIMEDLIADTNLVSEQRTQQIDNYLRTAADEVMNECNQVTEPTLQQQCVQQNVIPRLEELARLRDSSFGGNPTGSKAWFDRATTAINQAKSGQISAGQDSLFNIGEIIGGASRGIADSVLDAIGLVIRVFAICTNYVIESGFVLASIIGPIALGVSLFPFPQKPVFVWLLGYLGLGIWKIGNNVLAGLGAFILNRQDDFPGFNYIIFAVITGVFAPSIGAGMGAWSASQLAQNFYSGVGSGVRTVITYAGLGATLARK